MKMLLVEEPTMKVKLEISGDGGKVQPRSQTVETPESARSRSGLES